MNEAETRAEHIDPALREAGWGVVEGSKILREYLITPGRIEGPGRRGRTHTADYVLVYRNHKLAVTAGARRGPDRPMAMVAAARDGSADRQPSGELTQSSGPVVRGAGATAHALRIVMEFPFRRARQTRLVVHHRRDMARHFSGKG